MEDDVKTAKLNQSDESRLEDILKRMLTDDSELRRTADEEFKKISPDQKAFLLLRISKHSEASEELRSLSLNLLSRLLKDILHTWSSDNLAPFSIELMESLLSDTTDLLRERMGDILEQIANHSIELNSGVFAYPSIASFIQSSTENKCNALKRTALSVIRRVPNMFGIKRLSELRYYIQKSLADSDVSIRFSAVQTFFALIKDDTFSSLSPLLPSVIQICEEYLVAKGDTIAGYCPISSLLKLASQHAIPMRVHLDPVIHICSKVSSETNERIRAELQLLVYTLLKGYDEFVYTDESTSILTNFVLNYVPAIDSKLKEAQLHCIKKLQFESDSFTALLDIFTRRLYDYDQSVRSAALLSFIVNFEEYFGNEKFTTSHAILLPRLIELCEEQLLVREEYEDGYYPLCVLVKSFGRCPELLTPHSRPIVDLCAKIIVDFNRMRIMDNRNLTESALEHRKNTIDHLSTLLNITKERFDSCDSKTVAHLCQQLTIAAYSETEAVLRTGCLDLIYTIFSAADHIDESWSVIRRHLIHANNDSYRDKINTLFLIQSLPRMVKSETECDAASLIEASLLEVNAEIRQAAWHAFVAYSRQVKNEETIKKLGTIVPIAMKLIRRVRGERGGRSQHEVIFLEMYAPNPKVVEPYLRSVINYYCELINDQMGLTQQIGEMSVYWSEYFTEEEEERVPMHTRIKVMALRALASVTRNMHLAPIVKRSCPSLIPDIISSCLVSMSELEYDERKWTVADAIIEQRGRGTILERAAERALADMISSLKQDVFLPFMLQITEKMLTHVNWMQRNAGLMGLLFVARGFTDKNILETIKRILPLVDDPVLKVRSTACFTLGQISAGCAPALLELFHAIMVPVLISAHGDAHLNRVSAEAALAIALFCEAAPRPILSMHIPSIIRTAVVVLESTYRALLAERKIIILTQTLLLLVSANEAAHANYAHYYDRLIRPLKHIINNPPPNATEMYALAIECISLIGTAAGKKKFAADATEVMQSIMPRFDSLLDSSSDFAPSFAVIASGMGDSFLQIHPTVMTTIINAIRAPLVAYEDGEELDGEAATRKRSACKLAVALANALGESFIPFVGQLVELATARLSMDILRSERAWAGEIFPALISVVKGNEELRNKLWAEYWKGLREVMMREDGRSLRETEIFIRSIVQCIKHMEGVTQSEHAEIDEILKKEEKAHELRKMNRDEKKAKMMKEGVKDSREFDDLYEDEKIEEKIEESLASITMDLKRYFFPHPFSFLRRHKWL